MTFERSCIYHSTLSMRVIEAEDAAEFKRLLATGEWFDHPLKVKERIQNEKQIRRLPRKGLNDGERSTKTSGS